MRAHPDNPLREVSEVPKNLGGYSSGEESVCSNNKLLSSKHPCRIDPELSAGADVETAGREPERRPSSTFLRRATPALSSSLSRIRAGFRVCFMLCDSLLSFLAGFPYGVFPPA